MNDELDHYAFGRSSTLPTVSNPSPPAQVSIRLGGRQNLQRRRGAAIAIALLGAVGGFIWTLFEPRVYRASTSVEIQVANRDSAPGTTDQSADIQAEMAIIQSRELSDRVAAKINAQRGTLHLSPLGDDDISIHASAPGRIISVSCDSTDPQLAADVCNTLIREYSAQTLEARWASTEYTGRWLTKQLQDIDDKLAAQEAAMQSYAQERSLIVTGDASGPDTQLSDLQKELSSAQADRFARQSAYEMASAGRAGASPDVLDDHAIEEIQRTLNGLEAKMAQLSNTFTANHPEVKRLQVQIDTVEASLEAARANARQRLRNDLEAAQRREALLVAAYTSQARLASSKSEEAAHYQVLKGDADAMRAMRRTLQQRLTEASFTAALQTGTVRVVDAADPPGKPYKPDVLQRVAIGMVIGLVVGLAFSAIGKRAPVTLSRQPASDLAIAGRTGRHTIEGISRAGLPAARTVAIERWLEDRKDEA